MSYNPLTGTQIASAIANTVPVVTAMATAVTTISESSAIQLPSGFKSFVFTLKGTGTISATVEIQVSHDTITWLTHDVYKIALSGTTQDSDGFQDADTWKYHRVAVTAITGTGANVTVTASA